MSDASSSPKRPRLDFDDNSKDEQYDKFKSREQGEEPTNVSQSKSRKRADPDEDDVKDDDSKSKSLNRETTPREHTLVMRLANKEQELQECMNQIQEMKQAQTQKTAHLRSMLLDPAINLVFQRMAKEMDEHKEKLKQKQNELSAWKFTPDSQTGMRLMAKCRMLLQENGDLGKMISSGRTSRLEGEIALHKALVTEMKKNQKELDEFVGELEEDVEGMQGMIFMLQEQLKEAREQIARLQQENEQLRTLRMPPDPEPGGCNIPPWTDPHSTTSTPQQAGSPSVNASSTPPPILTSSSTSEYRTSGSGVLNQQPCCQSSNENPAVPTCGLASKVTPDSGMLTQEASMDTTDYASESPSPSHPPVTSSDRYSDSTGGKEAQRADNDSQEAGVKQEPSWDVDAGFNTLTSSSSSPDSSCRTNWRTSSAATGPSCDSNNARTTPPPSLNGKIEVHDSGDNGKEDSGTSPERTHTETYITREGKDSAETKERTGEEIETCQQSLHSTAGLTLGGKLDEDPTDAQVKETLVNGTTNQDL